MKKVFYAIIAILVIAVATWMIVSTADGKAFEKEPTTEAKVLSILTNNGCMSCHSAEPQLPFYSSFPIIGKTVQEDSRVGERYINLDSVVNALSAGKKVDYVTLAKIEHSARSNSMPLHKYKAIHWLSGLTENERNLLVEWSQSERMNSTINTQLAAQMHASEMVTPIPDSIPGLNPSKIELGKKLYHDVRLSKNNTISCATCHDLAGGGVDRLQYSKGIYDQIGGANAPTVYNAAFHIAQFWDGRLPDLQAQAGGPPFDALEMGSTDWNEICGKLDQDAKLKNEFTRIYKEGFTGQNITDAIAEFEKTLITPNSKFDKYLKGDNNALADQEIAGWELFKENKCATCHAGPAMGGLSFEYMGIFGDYITDRAQKQDREIIKIKDQGRYNFTQNPKDLGRYKVPTLRNVALTYPYMHDGTVNTLEEATKLMFKYQLNKKVSDEEVASIVTFMHTLTALP